MSLHPCDHLKKPYFLILSLTYVIIGKLALNLDKNIFNLQSKLYMG